MAPTTKPPAATFNNGVITDSSIPAVNRKKQKRRQKEAARRAAASDKLTSHDYASDEFDDPTLTAPPPPPPPPPPQGFAAHHAPPSDLRYDPRYGPHDHFAGETGTDPAYSDDGESYSYPLPHAGANGTATIESGLAKKKPKKKKKKNRNSQYDDAAYDDQTLDEQAFDSPLPPEPPLQDYVPSGPAISDEALRTVHQRVMDPIWDSTSVEEKSKIRSFWIGLHEEERKSLVKIEKEAVLKKMKEQQKHSCSCTVCGRKRTAIEEELEVLYDAYYEELEQYQKQVTDGTISSAPALEAPKQLQSPIPAHASRPSRGRIQEVSDNDDDEDDLDEDDGEYSEEEDYDEYSDEELDSVPPGAEDIFAFGRSLTVRGGILTVADDLLRNDGRKFIDMMEKLADRRMRRENRTFKPYKNSPHQMYYPQHYANNSEDEDEYYDDEDGDYDSANGDDEFEEEDEMDTMTEQQRMQEGRRMFQIFAARMFEQRVLNAYREKVARERQDRLIAEMEEESRADSQRDAKKARDAEKKKAKKQAQKQQKAEEKARKDAERAAAEAATKEAEAKKQEDQRRKREEQRKKREAEKKAQEEEKQRKEAEKQRRLQEERTRQQEAERKAREAKAEEKRRKDEARKKERDEREAREAAVRDKKTQEERAKQDGSGTKAEANEAKQKDDGQTSAPTQDPAKRIVAPPNVVALPPNLKQTRSTTSQLSPQDKGSVPVLPKAATPIKPPAPTSAVSDPNTPDTAPNSKQSTPPKSSVAPTSSQATSAGSMRGPSRHPPVGLPQQMSPPQNLTAPSGMPFTQGGPFANPVPGVNGFPGHQQPMIPAASQGLPPRAQPMYPSGPAMNFPHRPHPHPGNFPPGMNPGHPVMTGRGFPTSATPNAFGQAKEMPSVRSSRAVAQPRREPVQHSRHPSANFEPVSPPDVAHPPQTQPIARPAPIKRPDSTKPGEKLRQTDADDETEHFGSSALLSDALDDVVDDRRASGPPVQYIMPQHLSGFDSGGFNAFAGGARHTSGFPAPVGQSPGWGTSPTGWSGPGFGQPPAPIGRLGNNRPAIVRRLACQAFIGQQSLQAMEITELLRFADKNRPPTEPPISMADVKGILDTEGDANNGGGSFAIVDSGHNRIFVSWTPDHAGHRGSGYGLGEIGSPLPGNSMPAIGRH